MWKLQNTIKNYAWGSTSSLTQLFQIANILQQPQAEIWMGAHINGSSTVKNANDNSEITLLALISSQPTTMLGERTAARYGQLPYLFKVLAAEKPLSIQVHPNKQRAELGFLQENSRGIPLNALERNYKDPNHKPELVYALTPFKAMNGFRPIPDIIALFTQYDCEALSTLLDAFTKTPTELGLQHFFSALMSLNQTQKEAAISQLITHATLINDALAQLSLEFSNEYPGDIGAFSPLLLNVIELRPGEAMFLKAETLHAYIRGTALEIMSSSDNVLRAGLTPKFIDVDELIANTRFSSIAPEQLRLLPIKTGTSLEFPIPVDDFRFALLTAEVDTLKRETIDSAEILFCLDDSVTIKAGGQSIALKPGDAVFIPAADGYFEYQGEGRLARAFN